MPRAPLKTAPATLAICLRLMALICLIVPAIPGWCQTVTIDIPSVVNFDVPDVAQASTGTPNPFALTYNSAVLGSGNALRISVKSISANFTPPSGNSIPASNLSWSILGAVGGAGSPGTLSAAAYSLVYASDINTASGSVNLRWTLAAPGTGIRAGLHTLTMIWKVEAFTP
jgi:hypothetical protein